MDLQVRSHTVLYMAGYADAERREEFNGSGIIFIA